MENITPKMYDSKVYQTAPFKAIRTPDVIMKSAENLMKSALVEEIYQYP